MGRAVDNRGGNNVGGVAAPPTANKILLSSSKLLLSVHTHIHTKDTHIYAHTQSDSRGRLTKSGYDIIPRKGSQTTFLSAYRVLFVFRLFRFCDELLRQNSLDNSVICVLWLLAGGKDFLLNFLIDPHSIPSIQDGT